MELLYALEKIRTPFLDKIMSLVTQLGEETVFIVASIIVFWCISKKCGYYMLTVGFSGLILNQFLKLWFRIPRPWVKDPDFTIVESAREAATGYSFPSGHTQDAFAMLGCPATYSKNKWIKCVLYALVLVVSFSRMYLGVHTPLDVGVSFALGLILMIVMYPMFRDMEEKPKNTYILFSVFIVLALAFVLFVEFYRFPADIDLENLASGKKSAYMILFCALAMLLVYHVDRTKLQFPTDAVWWAQLIKLALGLGITLAIKVGLKAPLLKLCGGHDIATGLRYFAIIIFGGIVWPMTFKWFSKLGRK